jgi:tetratricopeptide (TPR) repeat protein
MSSSASGSDRLGQLADEILQRFRRGEKPALTEYTGRHPELAEQIRELFSALLLLEEVRPGQQTVIGTGAMPGGGGPPRRLGEYRLVREIGRGGMGIVYEAEQESLGRRVALKVLAPGALHDARHVERFQREARAAARLHHSNIVGVFGVGEDEGTHYYVMQYIEGRPLDEVLAELRKLRAAGDRPGSPRASPAGPAPPEQAEPASPTTPSSNLLSDPHRPFAKSVAHLGVQVADALDYAAGQGVLHRDIKPSNLLLDVWGTVWLTDFGLAKATGTPDLTRTGDLLGTLRYMAPERFEGRADVRSDVYALGLTLYELLAQRPAFSGQDQADLVRQITNAEVPRLDRLNPQLPRDLVTVVHKAMARDPADRYQTAGALAEDLRRFLDDRSIQARRASLPEQAWRLCRRHPSTMGMLAALLALLVLGTGSWLYVKGQKAERRGRAREAIEAGLKQVPALWRQGHWPQARSLLEQTENRLDEADSDDRRRRLEQARKDLELAERLEAIRLRRADFQDGDFAHKVADREYTRAFRLAELSVEGGEETAARIRASDIREELTAALDDWALSTRNVGLRIQLLELARLSDPDPQWRDRLRNPITWLSRSALKRLAARAPVAELSPQLLTVLGRLLRQSGADAESFLRAALRRHPQDFWLNYELATALTLSKPAEAVGFWRAAAVARPDCSEVYNMLGNALDGQGLREEAIEAYDKALELDPNNPGALSRRGIYRLGRGQVERALADCRRAVELEPERGWAHVNLGLCLERQGKMDEAMEAFRRAAQLDPTSYVGHHSLGMRLQNKGQFDEAIAAYRRAIERYPKWAPTHFNLGMCLQNKGRLDEAIAAYRRATELDPRDADPHFNLGLCLQNKGRLDEAIVEYRRTIELDPKGVTAYFNLGVCLQNKGRLDEAIVEYRRSIELDPRSAVAHDNLGMCLYDKREWDEALTKFRRATELDPKGALAHHHLGVCLQRKGHLDEAMEAFHDAVELDPRASFSYYRLGVALETRGRLEDALEAFREASAIDPGGIDGHLDLVGALLRCGRFGEAFLRSEVALDRVSATEPRRQDLLPQRKRCRELLALDARLPALLQGKERPSATEQLNLAQSCRDNGRPCAAARLYAAVFAAHPALAEDTGSRHRYAAACAAARAAAGQGPDAAPLDERQRDGLRRQALAWLKADLARITRLGREGKSVRWSLTTWQTDSSLTSVRDRAGLNALSDAQRKDWQRLWADVAALLAADPLEQGRLHAARREWRQAADCYAKVVKLKPIEYGHFWFEHAALLLLSGDRAGYARACARMIEKCGKEPDLRAYHVARACTLAPDSVTDAAQPGRLAESELKASAATFWSLTQRAALHYRAGRFTEAVPLLEKSLRAEPLSGRAVLNWLWLALAHQRLGKAAEAQRWLGRAQKWLDAYRDRIPDRANEEMGLHLHNWLEAHILRREAERLLQAR